MINYDTDFYGWSLEQADSLRAGRFNDLDIINLIDEIESMARSERRELQSRLTVLLLHMLKWQFQPLRRGRSWLLTIRAQRIAVAQVLRDNPSLKPKLDQCLSDSYRLACVGASNEAAIDESVFPAECPWLFSEVVDQAFFPD